MRHSLTFIIWVILASTVSAGDWIELFNGRDFDGWVIDGPKTKRDVPAWIIEDSAIVASGGVFGFLRYDKRQFDDFEFHLEYRLAASPKANGGIGIRTGVYDPAPMKSLATRPSFAAYEIQLLNDFDKKPTPYSTGSLYRYVAPIRLANKPPPEWNRVEIECRGPRIRIAINGELVQDFDQSTDPKLKDKPLRGYVCVQSHGSRAEYRHLRIRELKD